MITEFNIFNQELNSIDNGKQLISTINAHSYNVSRKNTYFKEALKNSNVLLPDGISIVWAFRLLGGRRLKKIAGADLFFYEMRRLNECNGKCFFLGSSVSNLEKISEKVALDYENVKIESYSPPYKKEFSEGDNKIMINKINAFKPDVLFVGMTAPKQEKWAYQHFNILNVGHVCCIGAVFDFYAETISRAPEWMVRIGLEWFYRLIKQPKRMWRRYLIGNIVFVYYLIQEMFLNKKDDNS